MDALCAAAPVARALLRVAGAAEASTLTVFSAAGSATLALEAGALWDVRGVHVAPLGDALLLTGELDWARHLEALPEANPKDRVGAWLVSAGVASEAAVRRALTKQLEARLLEVLRLGSAELCWRPGRTWRASGLPVSVPLASCLRRALVALARELPEPLLCARAGRDAQRVTPLGRRLEDVLSEVLSTALLSADPEPALLPQRAALRAIGALADVRSEPDAYGLLLRKRRELLRRESARRLLDLPESAGPEQGRSAFRKLVRVLHPDRFHAAGPRLSALSNEVLCALVSAEAELSAQAGRRARV